MVASLTETFDFFWDLGRSLLTFDFRFEALGGINATELVVCTDEGPLAVLSNNGMLSPCVGLVVVFTLIIMSSLANSLNGILPHLWV